METLKAQSVVNCLLECRICIDIYQDPRMLPCGHTFCLKCLQKQIDEIGNAKFQLSCALCRKVTSLTDKAAEGFPKNFAVEQFVTSLPSLSECASKDDGNEHGKVERFCVDCWEPLCDVCCKAHRKTRQTRAHTIKSITEITEEDVKTHKQYKQSFCSKHKNQELTLYCKTCDEFGCSTCVFKSHVKHDCIDLQEADKEFVVKMKTLKDLLQKQEKEIVFDIHTTSEKMNLFETESTKLLSDLENQFEEIENNLKCEYEKLKQCLTKSRNEALKAIRDLQEKETNRRKTCIGNKEIINQNFRKSITLLEKHLLPASTVMDRSEFLKDHQNHISSGNNISIVADITTNAKIDISLVSNELTNLSNMITEWLQLMSIQLAKVASAVPEIDLTSENTKQTKVLLECHNR